MFPEQPHLGVWTAKYRQMFCRSTVLQVRKAVGWNRDFGSIRLWHLSFGHQGRWYSCISRLDMLSISWSLKSHRRTCRWSKVSTVPGENMWLWDCLWIWSLCKQIFLYRDRKYTHTSSQYLWAPCVNTKYNMADFEDILIIVSAHIIVWLQNTVAGDMTLSQVATKIHEQNDHPFETTSTLFLDHVEI